MRGFALDVRPAIRPFAKAEKEDYAAQLAAHGVGGSLVQALRSVKTKIKRWGYVNCYSMREQLAAVVAEKKAAAAEGRAPAKRFLGQIVTFLVRGTAERVHKGDGQKTGRIAAHPIVPRPRVLEMAAAVEKEIARQMKAWERRAVA